MNDFFSGDPETIHILVVDDDEGLRELLVRYLEAAADLVEDPEITDGLVEVVTGLDYTGVNAEPAPATTTTTTTTAPGAISTTTSTTSAVTSTTRYGIVPGADDPANDCR